MNAKRLATAAAIALMSPIVATGVAAAAPLDQYVGCLIENIYCDFGDSTVFESEPAPAINMVPEPAAWTQNDSGEFEYVAPDYSDPASYDPLYYDYQTGEYVDAPSSSSDFSGDMSYTVNY